MGCPFTVSYNGRRMLKLVTSFLIVMIAFAPAPAQAGSFLGKLFKTASKVTSKVFKSGLNPLRAGFFLRAAIPGVGFGLAAASFFGSVGRQRISSRGGVVPRLPGGGAVVGRVRRPNIFRFGVNFRFAVRSRPRLFRRGIDLRPRFAI